MPGGRIAFTFYDLCDKLWRGWPAVTSLDCGIGPSYQKDMEQEESFSPKYFPPKDTILRIHGDKEAEKIDAEGDHSDSRSEDHIESHSSVSKNPLISINPTEKKENVAEMLKNCKEKKDDV